MASNTELTQQEIKKNIEQATRSLEEEKHLFEALLEHLPTGVIETNSEGHLLLYNHQAQQMLEEKHGIPDLLKPPSQSTDQFLEYGDIPSPSRSLKLKLVGCPLCEETRLPFWSLKPRAIRESRNVFGFPVYHSPYPGFEECDFHRLRVTVCPRCFYASSRIEDFIVQAGEPFQKDRVVIRKLWDHSCPELKKTLNELPSRFGTHSRTNDEAVLSYKIAIQSLAIMDKLQPDQDTKLELLTLGLLCSEKLEKLGRS